MLRGSKTRLAEPRGLGLRGSKKDDKWEELLRERAERERGFRSSSITRANAIPHSVTCVTTSIGASASFPSTEEFDKEQREQKLMQEVHGELIPYLKK